VQCNLWIHAKCEGLSDELCDNIMLLGGLNSVTYYCDTNNCISCINNCCLLSLTEINLISLIILVLLCNRKTSE